MRAHTHCVVCRCVFFSRRIRRWINVCSSVFPAILCLYRLCVQSPAILCCTLPSSFIEESCMTGLPTRTLYTLSHLLYKLLGTSLDRSLLNPFSLSVAPTLPFSDDLTPSKPTRYHHNERANDSRADVAGVVVRLCIMSMVETEPKNVLTRAQPRHQRPASPPPSSASAAFWHGPQLSPMRPMISIREMLRGDEKESKTRCCITTRGKQSNLPEGDKDTDER